MLLLVDNNGKNPNWELAALSQWNHQYHKWWCPTPQAVVFVTYLGQMEFETGSGYPGSCIRVASS